MHKRKDLKKNITLIWRTLKLIHKVSPNYLFFISVVNITRAFSPYVNIYMSAYILNELAGDRNPGHLINLVIITIVLNFAVSLISSALSRISSSRTFRYYQDFGMYYNLKVADLDYTTLEDIETHKKLDFVTEQAKMTGGGLGAFGWYYQSLINYFFSLIFSLAIISELVVTGIFVSAKKNVSWLQSPFMTFIFLILIVVVSVSSMKINAKTTRNRHKNVNNALPFNRIFKFYTNDYISNYKSGKDIRLYNEQDAIIEDMMSSSKEAKNTVNLMWKNIITGRAVSSFSDIFITLIVYIFTGLRALSGYFGVGNVIKYAEGINQFIYGIYGFMNTITMMFTNNECIEAYFNVIDIPNKMYRGIVPIEKRDMHDRNYEIEFRNVSFKYPSSETYALRNVSLKFKIGERLAVVGMNGSGKTTFIKLLCRLYDPTEGEVLLNGINIKEYDYDQYLTLFSVVFQDFNLFAITLGQNVGVSVDYDKKKAEECLKEAGFGDRYAEMQQGMETCLYKDFDEKGVEISGGEAQKIALARALYKDAPIIVFDEPTAALDPIAEFEIYSKFNKIVGDKTAIFISHRLSSCRFCDDIAVFHEGSLIEWGSHDKLVSNQEGKYHELWYAQAQYYS
jgi:ATP-binding cassette, subfamily B, bacterial